ENEIAQSESYTGKEFSRYWIHNGMLQLGGEKMSKSLGNIISIKDFLSKRSSDVMRMLVLNGTYRAPLMFNDETLDAAERNVERLKSALKPASPSASGLTSDALSASVESAATNFTDAMDNDFNTAGAVAALFELSKSINTARDNGATADQLKPAQETFKQLAGVLGLKLEEKKGSSEKEAEVEALLAERTQARKDKNWKRSDEIRDQLKAMGVTIEDSKDGTTWKWS
ncbi:MAG TPA: class I tRNA ligase family protein, partial [Anaerolineales bacterium]|nr:class I tRNA ligase family protein [Anaerolineales bacterium]